MGFQYNFVCERAQDMYIYMLNLTHKTTKHKHTVMYYCFNKHVMESDFINKIYCPGSTSIINTLNLYYVCHQKTE